MNLCSVDQCGRHAHHVGLCTMHYQRLRKHGSVGGPDRLSRSGAGNSNWRGGRIRGGHEMRYWTIHRPDHPNANVLGYVLEHRLVMEAHIGRFLTSEEIVHHINDDPSDNRIENLEVMTQSEHCRLHFTKTGEHSHAHS